MGPSPWKRCLERLEGELSPQQFNTWIRPLHAIENSNNIRLLAPNRFVLDWINERYLARIQELIEEQSETEKISLNIEIGSKNQKEAQKKKEPVAAVSKNGCYPSRANSCFVGRVCHHLSRAIGARRRSCQEAATSGYR